MPAAVPTPIGPAPQFRHFTTKGRNRRVIKSAGNRAVFYNYERAALPAYWKSG